MRKQVLRINGYFLAVVELLNTGFVLLGYVFTPVWSYVLRKGLLRRAQQPR